MKMSVDLTTINYRAKPFSVETPHDDFYTFTDIKDILCLGVRYKTDVRCRTIGILQSHFGKFYLSDLNASGVQTDCKIQVSMVYIKTPAPSTTIPYPVQVFGTIVWKQKPIIFITLMQVLTIPMAIRIKDIMSTIVKQHLATSKHIEEPE